MFTYQQGKDQSLQDFCGDLYHQGVCIKKQSLDQRFNSNAVDFMQSILAKVLEHQFEPILDSSTLSSFNRIPIKDSTRFALPDSYASVYFGHGGATANSAAMISVQ